MKKIFRKNTANQAPPSKKSQMGFSLLEMIVSIVIFLIVTGAIYGLLQIGRIDRNRSSSRSDMLKNARTAIHLIGRDALNAGLGYHRRGAVVPDNFLSTRLGVPVDTNIDRDILTSIVVGNNLNTNSLNSDANVRTDLISFAYRDTAFNVVAPSNVGNPISLADVTAPGGAPQTARLVTNTGQATAARTYDLFLVESDSSQIAVMASNIPNTSNIDIAFGDPLGLNQAFNATGVNGSMLKKCTVSLTENCTTYLASTKKFIWVAYKVKADGTLVRMIFGNNTGRPSDEQIQEQPIAYNVQDLQIKYVLEDGTTIDNPTVGLDGNAGTNDDDMLNSNFIRQISLTLQVQSTEIDEQTKKPLVITLNATFSVRNLEYDAG